MITRLLCKILDRLFPFPDMGTPVPSKTVTGRKLIDRGRWSPIHGKNTLFVVKRYDGNEGRHLTEAFYVYAESAEEVWEVLRNKGLGTMGTDEGITVHPAHIPFENIAFTPFGDHAKAITERDSEEYFYTLKRLRARFP